MIAYSYVFILLTLASGYTSLKLSHITKYRIIKYSGQELFFSSAVVGMAIFLLGYVTCKLITKICTPLFIWYSSFYADTSIMYAVSGWIISFPLIFLFVNNIFKNDYSITKYIEEQNDGLERILKISELYAKPILVTLSSGKIYIGLVSQSFFSPIENKSFTILPLFSGYRDSQTQELQIMNKYIDYITQFTDIEDENEINNFIIALPIDAIVSASIFNFDVYKEFNSENVNDSDDFMSITE
jgi:hypothetical protein